MNSQDENPYRSPIDTEPTTSAGWASLGAGLLGGFLIGATYGSAGGAAFGLSVGALAMLSTSGSSDPLGYLVMLTIAGGLIGLVLGAVGGSLLAAPLWWWRSRSSGVTGRTTLVRNVAVIAGAGGAVTGLACGVWLSFGADWPLAEWGLRISGLIIGGLTGAKIGQRSAG